MADQRFKSFRLPAGRPGFEEALFMRARKNSGWNYLQNVVFQEEYNQHLNQSLRRHYGYLSILWSDNIRKDIYDEPADYTIILLAISNCSCSIQL